ncbi:MAG: hypothetical protein HN802_05935 [Candidatus Jacksonbacteria bacterium]|jgi:hypothetical protein|nr:hypothetical protein [Candidatus Jacksonbacteria bacterium]MBT6955159.1 hypothetical protein [Candidatus Jacksonbacteria bacterium]MBT7007860.1 hypothetical protein [Candidatus Jacksonbacteria bacterium]MBT7339209.1 hypothetical protein [Candidatus Jacksonbacteria bacterium]
MPKVLVVDSGVGRKGGQQMYQTYAGGDGVAFVFASTQLRAIALCEDGNERVALVVMSGLVPDIPGAGGCSTVDLVETLSLWYPDVPFIGFTSDPHHMTVFEIDGRFSVVIDKTPESWAILGEAIRKELELPVVLLVGLSVAWKDYLLEVFVHDADVHTEAGDVDPSLVVAGESFDLPGGRLAYLRALRRGGYLGPIVAVGEDRPTDAATLSLPGCQVLAFGELTIVKAQELLS